MYKPYQIPLSFYTVAASFTLSLGILHTIRNHSESANGLICTLHSPGLTLVAVPSPGFSLSHYSRAEGHGHSDSSVTEFLLTGLFQGAVPAWSGSSNGAASCSSTSFSAYLLTTGSVVRKILTLVNVLV